jgi:hypothetical protein
MTKAHTHYLPPFDHERFYLVPLLWLRDVREALDLDARDLLLSMHLDRNSNLLTFPEGETIAYWVRENGDGLPNLMSHVSFAAQLKRLLAEEPQRPALLQQDRTFREVFQLVDWPAFAHLGVIYKPRSYIRLRWPVWLGASLAARAALLGLLAQLAEARLASDLEPLSVTATKVQVRKQVKRLLPASAVDAQVGVGLRQLCDLRLVELTESSRHNTTYRLAIEAFTRPPRYTSEDVAAALGLDRTQHGHWVALVEAFLRHNFLPLEQSQALWRKIRSYDPDIATETDARTLLRTLEAQAGRASTNPTRILADYVKRKAKQAWQYSSSFAIRLHVGEIAQSKPEVTMPALYGAQVHLQATQLVLTVEPPARLALVDAVMVLQTELANAQLDILQGETLIQVTNRLRPTLLDLRTQWIIDCNHLHRQLDYAQPLQLLLRYPSPAGAGEAAQSDEAVRRRAWLAKFVLRGQFRVLVTSPPGM